MEQNNQEKKNRDSYIVSLRKELLYIIEKELTPMALKYNYSDVALESKIKWKPIVLILGNYSSGKSTLINEFLGRKIQHSGQAPTDDCFTVITSTDEDTDENNASDFEVEERDGKVLLYDPQYPFEVLKKYGDKFATHFRLKKIKGVSQLKNLAIIDTPGMLDSVTEKDRGYDYQKVIGDLAQISDLVLVLFDPHKAGTIRESYASLRETLPEKTYEDRLIYVLNRIDECGNIKDLIRVYGTLCWNLSQMTGRKDIPRILMTYSHAFETNTKKPFLEMLGNQKEELQQAILNAPKHRLDNLASFVEHHSSRLSLLLNTLQRFYKKRRGFLFRGSLIGLFTSLMISVMLGLYLDLVVGNENTSGMMAVLWGALLATCLYTCWSYILYKFVVNLYQLKIASNLEKLITSRDQLSLDSWNNISTTLKYFLNDSDKQRTNLSILNKECETLNELYLKGTQEIRIAINQLDELK